MKRIVRGFKKFYSQTTYSQRVIITFSPCIVAASLILLDGDDLFLRLSGVMILTTHFIAIAGIVEGYSTARILRMRTFLYAKKQGLIRSKGILLDLLKALSKKS